MFSAPGESMNGRASKLRKMMMVMITILRMEVAIVSQAQTRAEEEKSWAGFRNCEESILLKGHWHRSKALPDKRPGALLFIHHLGFRC